MASNVRKNAMKRLMMDLEELKNSPVDGVSAAPLDENMFEWHCNFLFQETVYHIILFFPNNYPYVSPSAEFVPVGFRFMGGATMNGKKGVKVCLSIFSDFANYHKEWANEKSAGWSPAYTVQTVLMNLVSFLADMSDQYGGGHSSYMDDINKQNKKLAEGYSCKDCGHTHKKPFPPLSDGTKKGKAKSQGSDSPIGQIVDYISKTKFQDKVPSGKEDLFGFGLIKSGPKTRPSLTSPCEFLSGASFYGMQKSVEMVQSSQKDPLSYFLPLYITHKHGSAIQPTFEDTMKELANLLPSCKRLSIPEMVLKTIPNLMAATVVEFSKGTQHTSDNHLNGYFALHRLLLWAIQTYPELQAKIDEKLENFIENDNQRTKKACPHIGEWLMLLSGSSKFRWSDAADAYISESWRRNVMWYVKEDDKLGYLDTDKKYRIDRTLVATNVSRKILTFQVLFLDIAMPPDMTRAQIIKRYDDNHGFPTQDMVTQLKESFRAIPQMKTYQDWLKAVKLKPLSDDEVYERLLASVEFAINTDGYKWTFFKDQGGWFKVLKKYGKGTPGWKGKPRDVPPLVGEDGSVPAGKGKGKGKGKSSKSVQFDKAEPMEVEEVKDVRGKKRKLEVIEEEEEEEEEKAVKGKGKGRGKRSKVEPPPEEEEDDDEPVSVGRGKAKGGRGKGVTGGRGARGKGTAGVRGRGARGRGSRGRAK